jgi:hypothetical protein
MYCTFVLFLNQHFPGLPASGTLCSWSPWLHFPRRRTSPFLYHSEQFSGRWIGRRVWLFTSKESTLNSHGGITKALCTEKEGPVSSPGLCRRITAAIAPVPVDVLSRLWDEVKFRFDVCSGAPTEFYYNCTKTWRKLFFLLFVNTKCSSQSSE